MTVAKKIKKENPLQMDSPMTISNGRVLKFPNSSKTREHVLHLNEYNLEAILCIQKHEFSVSSRNILHRRLEAFVRVPVSHALVQGAEVLVEK